MQTVRRWCWLLFLLLYATGLQAAKTQVRLILESEEARPGDTITAGVVLQTPKGLHTYWRNSGEFGGPTKIDWQLPDGITAGAIQWPVPEKDITAVAGVPTTSYVYNDTVVLLVPLTVSFTAPSGSLEISAKLSWFECSAQQCVIGHGTVKTGLVVGANTKKSADANLIEEWQKKLPELKGDLSARASWEKPGADPRNLIIEWTASSRGAEPDFYPFESKGYEIGGATEKLPPVDGKLRLKKVVKKLEGEWPAQVAGLLIEKSGNGPKAFQVQMPITTEAAAAPTGSTPAAAFSGNGPKSLWGALGLAFLGGLILNIMPCVLPVIALKVLGFVNQSQKSSGQASRLGLIYTLGVLASFLALAGLVVGIQQAGRTASWGMQFQDPRFVIAMTIIVTLVALNLFGVFEVLLPGAAMGAASDLSAKQGAAGAFFNGVLATALATPCTAPFLAVALGFAFAQPPLIVILIFLVIGLGLAAPYVLLTQFPQLLRFLPKPGAWMEKFKIAMGFPMLATAIWLLTLTESHFGDRGPLWVGLFLVLLAFATWIWGEFFQKSGRHHGLAVAASFLLVGVGYGYCLEKKLHWRTPEPLAKNGGQGPHSAGGIDWQPWSTAAVEKARAEGHPVLVDFTAKWCLTCKLNEGDNLEVDSVRSKLKETNTIAMQGDFSREDPAIASELKRFGQSGVPMVLVYPKDLSRPPVVLPIWPELTPRMVVVALDDAAKLPRSPPGTSGESN